MILTDEGLPFTCGTRVTSEVTVGLETNFTVEGGERFTLVSGGSREEGSLELGLDEELRVKDVGGRVEGRSGNGFVNVIGGSDRVAIE